MTKLEKGQPIYFNSKILGIWLGISCFVSLLLLEETHLKVMLIPMIISGGGLVAIVMNIGGVGRD